MGTETQICPRCNALRLLTDFYRNRRRKSGRHPNCRFCVREMRRVYVPVDEQAKYDNEYRRTPRGRFVQMKGSAKARGHECLLTLESYAELIQKPCFYCSESLPVAGTGLDRLDNPKGYIIDNVVPCCTECNKIRGANLTVAEMQAVAELLKKLRAGRGELQ